MRVLFIVLIASILTLNADSYSVKFKGITLGEIERLDTLKSNYLKAKVTNSIARFLIGERYFVFHSGDEPKIKDAKFRRDKNMILFAFLQSLTDKPKYKRYQISDIKDLVLECNSSKCTFLYHKKGKLKGRGVITFDDNGEFVKLVEEIASVEISKR